MSCHEPPPYPCPCTRLALILGARGGTGRTRANFVRYRPRLAQPGPMSGASRSHTTVVMVHCGRRLRPGRGRRGDLEAAHASDKAAGPIVARVIWGVCSVEPGWRRIWPTSGLAHSSGRLPPEQRATCPDEVRDIPGPMYARKSTRLPSPRDGTATERAFDRPPPAGAGRAPSCGSAPLAETASAGSRQSDQRRSWLPPRRARGQVGDRGGRGHGGARPDVPRKRLGGRHVGPRPAGQPDHPETLGVGPPGPPPPISVPWVRGRRPRAAAGDGRSRPKPKACAACWRCPLEGAPVLDPAVLARRGARAVARAPGCARLVGAC